MSDELWTSSSSSAKRIESSEKVENAIQDEQCGRAPQDPPDPNCCGRCWQQYLCVSLHELVMEKSQALHTHVAEQAKPESIAQCLDVIEANSLHSGIAAEEELLGRFISQINSRGGMSDGLDVTQHQSVYQAELQRHLPRVKGLELEYEMLRNRLESSKDTLGYEEQQRLLAGQ